MGHLKVGTVLSQRSTGPSLSQIHGVMPPQVSPLIAGAGPYSGTWERAVGLPPALGGSFLYSEFRALSPVGMTGGDPQALPWEVSCCLGLHWAHKCGPRVTGGEYLGGNSWHGAGTWLPLFVSA